MYDVVMKGGAMRGGGAGTFLHLCRLTGLTRILMRSFL